MLFCPSQVEAAAFEDMEIVAKAEKIQTKNFFFCHLVRLKLSETNI